MNVTENQAIESDTRVEVVLKNQGAEETTTRHIPLRVKITLPFLILAIALAIGAAILITQIVFDTVNERFTNQLIESGKISSAQMVREETAILTNLRLLAHADGIASAIQQADAERLRELSYGIVVDSRQDAVEFLDVNGNLVLSMRHTPGGAIEDYQFVKQGDDSMKQWEFVQQVLIRHQDERGDKFAGYADTDWGHYYYIAGPVYDEQDNFVGVVVVGTTLQTIADHLREKSLTQVTMYDFTGMPIVSTFSKPPQLDSDQINLVISGQESSSLRRNSTSTVVADDIEYEEILSPWQGRGGNDLGIMGISLAKSFLVSVSRVTRFQITGLVAAAFVLVVLVGLNLSSSITRPISDLVKASQAVAEGDLNVKVKANTNDEIKFLASAFNQMVDSLYRSKMDLVNAYDSTLQGWSMALELRDKETKGHTLRVADLTVEFAHKLGLPTNTLPDLRRGAVLHDIGKMGIPDDILLKPGPLTDEEWELMYRHPQYAYDMIGDIENLKPALAIPYYHHEHWDGSGYPHGLKGEDIPIEARIFTIVDVWDALTSNRPYRAAWTNQQTIQYIQEQSGKLFDPMMVSVFFELLAEKGIEFEVGDKGEQHT
jgi:HD-GYP domain-containing protein (c-di-GMP phosphodiesterase class II)